MEADIEDWFGDVGCISRYSLTWKRLGSQGLARLMIVGLRVFEFVVVGSSMGPAA